MIIRRILTNNAVVIIDQNQEKIVCGKGIGFKKKPGMEVDRELITQVFVLEENNTEKYEALLKDVPMEYVEIASEIISLARVQFTKPISDSVILTLCDHIYSAVERIKQGLEIQNGLLWDIKNFYEIEFEIGMQGLKMIKDRLSIDLPEDEAGYIALHIVNSQMGESDMQNAYKVTKLIQEVTTIVRYFYSFDFDTSNIYYYRFVTHLKFFALRLFNGKQIESDDSEMLLIVKKKFPLAYDCVMNICEFISIKYNYQLNDEEKLYLTIHVHRVVSKTKDR